MIVQSTSAAFFATEIARSTLSRPSSPSPLVNITDTVRISQAARDAFAASSGTENSDKSIEARLAEIRAHGPVNRSQEDHDFLFANDKRLAEISAKSYDTRTADEIDYMQKSTGLVNTFAHLSSTERALYDKAIASGNSAAAEGIAQIALIRQGGEIAGGANGTTYNPRTTEITVANIENFFSNSIVDSTGNAASRFQALVQLLQGGSTA